jgi:hypothetical protein
MFCKLSIKVFNDAGKRMRHPSKYQCEQACIKNEHCEWTVYNKSFETCQFLQKCTQKNQRNLFPPYFVPPPTVPPPTVPPPTVPPPTVPPPTVPPPTVRPPTVPPPTVLPPTVPPPTVPPPTVLPPTVLPPTVPPPTVPPPTVPPPTMPPPTVPPPTVLPPTMPLQEIGKCAKDEMEHGGSCMKLPEFVAIELNAYNAVKNGSLKLTKQTDNPDDCDNTEVFFWCQNQGVSTDSYDYCGNDSKCPVYTSTPGRTGCCYCGGCLAKV